MRNIICSVRDCNCNVDSGGTCCLEGHRGQEGVGEESSGKPEKYLTGLAGLFPAYSENKPVKNGDYGFKPY